MPVTYELRRWSRHILLGAGATESLLRAVVGAGAVKNRAVAAPKEVK